MHYFFSLLLSLSKTALTLYPKDGNYMRTGEVAETESDNNKEKK